MPPKPARSLRSDSTLLMKAQLLGLTVALFGGASLFAFAQDKGPDVTPPVKETPVDAPPLPERIGTGRLSGIKIKPKTVVTVQQGPATSPPARPLVTAPDGKGGISFVPGSQVVDFGDLIQGEVRDTTFRARSSGEDPLVIGSIGKTCGCTRAEIVVFDADGNRVPYRVGTPIPSGEEFLVEAIIDTTGKSHAFKSDITLTTNDPRRGVVFTLRANVQPALEMNPRSLNLSTMKATDEKRGQVVITSAAYGRFKLEIAPNVPVTDIQVELVPNEPDADGMSDRWVAQVVAGPNLPEGVLNRAVRLVSSLAQPDKFMPDGTPQYFDAVLFVVGNVLGPVSVNPPHLSFGLLRPGQTLTRKATVEITDPDFTLTEAPAYAIKGYGTDFPHPEDFQISFVPVEGSKNWELVMTLLGMEQEGNGSFRGYVEVQLDHPAKPVLEVAFSGVVRAGVGQPATGGR